MALSNKVKKNITLFKEYCSTFGLKIISDPKILKKWESARGPMFGATFLNGDITEAPIAWVTPDPDGEFMIEQDEDLLSPNEPAVSSMEESVVRAAINNKRPIHPVS